MTVLCSDKTGTLTTANMTVDFNDIKTWNGFTKEQVGEERSLREGGLTCPPPPPLSPTSLLSPSLPSGDGLRGCVVWRVHRRPHRPCSADVV